MASVGRAEDSISTSFGQVKLGKGRNRNRSRGIRCAALPEWSAVNFATLSRLSPELRIHGYVGFFFSECSREVLAVRRRLGLDKSDCPSIEFRAAGMELRRVYTSAKSSSGTCEGSKSICTLSVTSRDRVEHLLPVIH
jgi:hypothetical protein